VKSGLLEMPLQLNEFGRRALKDRRLLFRVRRIGGFWQNVEFVVEGEHAGAGTFPVLTTKKTMEKDEQVRVAEEVGLPVRTNTGLVFFKGTGAADFVGL